MSFDREMLGLIAGVTLVALVLYHFAFVAPRLRTIGRALRGEDEGIAGDSVARLRGAHAAFSNRTEQRLAELESVAKLDVHRVGFVRYNSFSDVGSDLSFTLALLNREGDGVLITSIYSREETRTYGKAVRKFATQQGASKEELEAISAARDGARSAIAS
jgi:hypothetical protein